MALVFTEDQDQFRDSIQRFLSDQMPTTGPPMMATDHAFDHQLWQQLVRLRSPAYTYPSTWVAQALTR